MLRRTQQLIAAIAVLGLGILVASDYATQQNITAGESNAHVAMHVMDAKECSQAFGKNVISAGYQPINLTIINNSDDLLILRSTSITLPLENTHTVLYAAQHPTFWTTFLTSAVSALYFWPALVPSVGVGLWMSWDNARINKRIKAAILEHEKVVEIFPCEQITKTLFVARDAVPATCSLYLFNVHKKTFIPYTVTLCAAESD